MGIAREFSPRIECHRDGLVSIDVAGLDRLIGPPRAIGDELRRTAAGQGVHVHVAVARTRSAALILAIARPGVTVVDEGREREAVASLPVSVLEKAYGSWLMAHGSAHGSAHDLKPGALRLEPLHTGQPQRTQKAPNSRNTASSATSAVNVLKGWGIRTLGEFGALPAADLCSRLGPQALAWQTFARGEDAVPLVPTLPAERFESSLELDWPIEGLEPLSFVLTRLLEPLSVRLERRDRGTAILHLELRLVTKEVHARHLQLPSPIRDVRTLRTLLLLDLDSHPPPAAIDCVAIQIDPTPGRVVQHTLFTRAQPTPEQLSTLVARLNALMGQDRIGAPATVDSHRPGAFEMKPLAIERDHDQRRARRDRREMSAQDGHRRDRGARRENSSNSADSAVSAVSAVNVISALRRCRQPIPARVAIDRGRPVRLTTDRRGLAGGAVVTAAGPWRTSGHWWAGGAGRSERSEEGSVLPVPPFQPLQPSWDRDEWDVAIADGGVYRIFRDRGSNQWFVDAIVD